MFLVHFLTHRFSQVSPAPFALDITWEGPCYGLRKVQLYSHSQIQLLVYAAGSSMDSNLFCWPAISIKKWEKEIYPTLPDPCLVSQHYFPWKLYIWERWVWAGYTPSIPPNTVHPFPPRSVYGYADLYGLYQSTLCPFVHLIENTSQKSEGGKWMRLVYLFPQIPPLWSLMGWWYPLTECHSSRHVALCKHFFRSGLL